MSAATHARSVIGMYMQGWQALGILAAANLGLADQLADRPREVEELAHLLGVNDRTLFRLMRDLSSRGVFRRVGERAFENSPLSEALRSGAPGGAREMIRSMGLASTRRLTAAYERVIATGLSAWELELGCRGAFDAIEGNPEEAAIYDEGMTAVAVAQAEAITDRFDFSPFPYLIDIGGGQGAFLASVLAKHPRARGALLDLAKVVAGAPAVLARYGVAARCQIHAGNFFDDVPGDGNAYILKSILHGHSDEGAARILSSVHRRAAPGAHLIVIELVMPTQPGPTQALFDLFLLLGGLSSRVRTEGELRQLLRENGFDLCRIIPTAGPACVIEARLVA